MPRNCATQGILKADARYPLPCTPGSTGKPHLSRRPMSAGPWSRSTSNPDPRRRSAASTWRSLTGARVFLSAALVAVALPACGDLLSGGGPELDDETFVEVFVDLRIEALRSHGGEIEPEERDRILEKHGVEDEDLIAFVEAHSADIHRMTEIWEAVSDRMAEEAEEDPEVDDVEVDSEELPVDPPAL